MEKSKWKIKDLLTKYSSHIDFLDLELLIAHTIKKPREFVLAYPEQPLTQTQTKNLDTKVTRRRHGEPLAYILGYKEFYGLNFFVTKDALIPRPETEILVDLAREEIKKIKMVRKKRVKISVIDVGTGSGNIIVSIAKEIKKEQPLLDIKYYATDISTRAIDVAKKNAKQHRVKNIIQFNKNDLVSSYFTRAKQKRDTLIIANLPYLSQTIYNNTIKDIHDFEPKNALVSEKRGLDHYYRLLKNIKNARKLRFITLFLEISPEQSVVLQKYALTLFPKAFIKIKKDLAGKNRVFEMHATLS